MFKASISVCVFFFISFSLIAQNDTIGAGRSFHFDGVDDVALLGNLYDSLYVPITISAWVFLDEGSDQIAPIFVRQDPDDEHDELVFYITSNQIVIGFGNGVVKGIPIFRRYKEAFLDHVTGRWIHVAGIIRSPEDMELFVNGINVGGVFIGNSNLDIVASKNDQVTIGYWNSSGQKARFMGQIDEVRVWSRSLPEAEIRTQMCVRLSGDEPGLVGYWSFDETAGVSFHDRSPGHHNGITLGSPGRPFSGAPIGVKSSSIYAGVWDGWESSMESGADKISVSEVEGNPEGIHFYLVRNLPSQQQGLNLARVGEPYFGVFIASLDIDNHFGATLFHDGVPVMVASTRTDNSAAWHDLPLPAVNVSQRAELIRQCGASNINVELGADKNLCDQTLYVIDSGNDPMVNPILWSTGDTTATITVTKSGAYGVVVGLCDAKRDSVKITFYSTPDKVFLGEDVITCSFVHKKLEVDIDSTGFFFEWQDGSANATFDANQFGTYTVKVFNPCGESSDTIQIRKPLIDRTRIPNVITPNGDKFNQYFEVEELLRGQVTLLVVNRWGELVYKQPNYDNDWDGGALVAGIYYLKLSGACVDVEEVLSIIR